MNIVAQPVEPTCPKTKQRGLHSLFAGYMASDPGRGQLRVQLTCPDWIVALERWCATETWQGMGWRMPVPAESSIRLKCRKPFGGECLHAAGCLTGLGAFPRRRGIDTLTYWLPLVPAKGMAEQPGVYQPIADGEIICTFPASYLDSTGWRKVNKGKSCDPCLRAGINTPCPFGDTPSTDGPGSSPGRVADCLSSVYPIREESFPPRFPTRL